MNDQLIRSIKKLKVDKGLTNSDIAAALGISEAKVKNYMSGKTPIPADHVKTLSITFGTLLAQDIDIPEPRPFRTAQAGRTSTANYKVAIRNLLSPIIEDLPEATYELFQADGSSMTPTVHQGDWLLCRLDSCDSIIDGRVYVLVIDNKQLLEFRRSGIWIKRVYYRKQAGYITCKSDNIDGSEGFSTFRVKASEVVECWYPVRKISGQLSDPNRDLYTKMDELESRIEMLESLNE